MKSCKIEGLQTLELLNPYYQLVVVLYTYVTAKKDRSGMDAVLQISTHLITWHGLEIAAIMLPQTTSHCNTIENLWAKLPTNGGLRKKIQMSGPDKQLLLFFNFPL